MEVKLSDKLVASQLAWKKVKEQTFMDVYEASASGGLETMRYELELLSFTEFFFNPDSKTFGDIVGSVQACGLSRSQAKSVADVVLHPDKHPNTRNSFAKAIISMIAHNKDMYTETNEGLLLDLEGLKNKAKDLIDTAEKDSDRIAAIKAAQGIIGLQAQSYAHADFMAPKKTESKRLTLNITDVKELLLFKGNGNAARLPVHDTQVVRPADEPTGTNN